MSGDGGVRTVRTYAVLIAGISRPAMSSLEFANNSWKSRDVLPVGLETTVTHVGTKGKRYRSCSDHCSRLNHAIPKSGFKASHMKHGDAQHHRA